MKLPITRRTLPRTLVLAALALTFCVEQARLVSLFLSLWTNEDHAVLWHAAADWARLRPREPTFYGQPYGVNFEAIPMAFLHAFGMRYGTALPVAMLGMAALAWVLLVWASLRRGHVLPALVAAALPLLINSEHWIIVGVIGTGVGRLLAAVCAALALRERNTPLRAFWIVALGTFAVVIDTASATLALPALVWAGLGWLRRPKLWLTGAVGVVPSIAFRLYNRWFDQHYPDHALHPAVPFETSWDVFEDNWHNADRLFAAQSLELYKVGAVVLWTMLILWLITLGVRAWRELAAISCSIALFGGLLSLTKTLDSMYTIWLPSARMTLTTPMAVWFAFSLTFMGVTRWLKAHSIGKIPWLEPATLTLLGVLCTWSSAERAAGQRQRLHDIGETALSEGRLPPRTVADVENICHDAAIAAREADTHIVLFPSDRAANYACPAINPGMLTAYPGYERRYWILRRLAANPVDHMLVWGVGADTCKQKRIRRKFKACEAVSNGQAVRVDFDPQPPLDAARKMGFFVRPFGPDCEPARRETCKWWASRFNP